MKYSCTYTPRDVTESAKTDGLSTQVGFFSAGTLSDQRRLIHHIPVVGCLSMRLAEKCTACNFVALVGNYPCFFARPENAEDAAKPRLGKGSGAIRLSSGSDGCRG